MDSRIGNVCAALVCATLGAAACGGSAPGPGAPPPPPTPLPVVAPVPQPLSATCDRLPLGSAIHSCRDDTSSYHGDVIEAIATLQSEHPEFFEGNIVVNEGAYYAGLIRNLDRRNLCAAFDGEELAVKGSNDFSEQFKVLTSWGEIRRLFVGTCYPAVFPLSRPNPPASPPGCPLAPSVDAACGRTDPRFAADVESSIDQVIRQRPELFDLEQTSGGADRPLVRDIPAYHAAVVAALASHGYCGLDDGEEIQVKRTNEFSEHYDINVADQYVRRGSGIYRITCYPAAF